MLSRDININKGQQGFTVFEILIALVIVAFIVSAILVGNKLIENSKVSAQVAFMQDIKTKHNIFRDKYGQYAGDFDEAERMFATGSHELDNMGLVNGDGDGFINFENTQEYLNNNNFGGESKQYFVHMAAFNFLDAISPLDGEAIKGRDFPKNPYDEGFGSIVVPVNLFDINDDATIYTPFYDNLLGRHYLYMNIEANDLNEASSTNFIANSSNTIEIGNAFDVVAAVKMDRKIDDGLPATGALMVPVIFSGIEITRDDYLADGKNSAEHCVNFGTENAYLEVYSGDDYDCPLMWQLDVR